MVSEGSAAFLLAVDDPAFDVPLNKTLSTEIVEVEEGQRLRLLVLAHPLEASIAKGARLSPAEASRTGKLVCLTSCYAGVAGPFLIDGG
jgi:hypothetical protein